MKSRTKDDKKGKNAGAGADAGGSNDGAGAAAEHHQSAWRRYHDALSSGVGLDAKLHGTSRAMPGFPRASKPTPPSSPPRMFPAPGQATGPGAATTAPWGALDVNNGAPHPAGARSRPNASSAAHHGGSRPSLESSTHAAALSRSSAHDRWRAAGAAAGVPQDVGEGTKKKRSGFILAYKAVKRSMGIPSKKDKAAAKESAEKEEAKPRGAVAFASVLPPRKNPERHSAENAPTTTTTPEATKNMSARDLWAAAGAAAGVTDAAVASAAKKRSPLLMAYKKMKRIAGIPSKKDKEAEKAEKAAAEARANFPATPKTLPELAAADPMRQSPPGRSATVPETRYQSALAQIIGPPIGGHARGPSTSSGGSVGGGVGGWASAPDGQRRHPSSPGRAATESTSATWDPALVDRILGGDVEGAIRSGQTLRTGGGSFSGGGGRASSSFGGGEAGSVEALLAMAADVAAEEDVTSGGGAAGGVGAGSFVRSGEATSADIRARFADAMREAVRDMRRRHDTVVAIASGMERVIEDLREVEPAAVAFGRLQRRTGFVGEAYRSPLARSQPYVVSAAIDLDTSGHVPRSFPGDKFGRQPPPPPPRATTSTGAPGEPVRARPGRGVFPPEPLDLGELPDPPGMDEHWRESPVKARMDASAAAVDSAVAAAASLFAASSPSPADENLAGGGPNENGSFRGEIRIASTDETGESLAGETTAPRETKEALNPDPKPPSPPPRHRFTAKDRARITSSFGARPDLPPNIKRRVDAMSARTESAGRASAVVDEEDELSDELSRARRVARSLTRGTSQSPSPSPSTSSSDKSSDVNVGGWLARPERFVGKHPESANGASPAASAAARARNASAAARRRLRGARGGPVGLEAKFRAAASESESESESESSEDGAPAPPAASPSGILGGGDGAGSPVEALRARGLAPKASSDLESLRRLRRRLEETKSGGGGGTGGTGSAAKVLGDLARLGGYTSWDQVPTDRRGRHGDLDDASSLLTSPASEADVRRAREAFGSTRPGAVHDARLRAAMAVDVRMRRARMSSPGPGGGSPGHQSLAQRRAAYREARARAMRESGY